MRTAVLVALVGLIALAYGQRVVVSEENSHFNPSTWKIGDESNGDDVITFNIFLPQENLDTLDEEFLRLTTPGSPQWRHWKTIEEVKAITAPSPLVKAQVRRWLSAARRDVVVEDFIDAFKVTAPISFVSELFDTTFYRFTHLATGTVVNRQVGQMSLPRRVSEHVEFISGVSEFPNSSRKFQYSRSAIDEIEGKVVPYIIDQLYDIPYEDKTEVTKDASVGVIEYQGDRSFAQNDLTYFQQQNLLPQQQVPQDQIIGPYNAAFPDGEATLDIQYAWGVSYNTSAWYWTVEGWLLDWALAFQATTDKPNVVSMSWGWTEDNQCEIASCSSSRSYVDRVNTEFQQITMTGVTMTASSGDQGAPGDGDTNCRNTNEPVTSIFPGASPYVLSIGATMLVSSSNYNEEENIAEQPVPPVCDTFECVDLSTTEEVACSWPDALITTGGGFSDYSPRPSWQDDVVTAYLNTATGLPPSSDYNGANRGFPDVSALGHNYLIRINSGWETVDGTSCSAPVWAGLISLWNDYEAKNGRPPLGFINPLIYQLYGENTATFNDIVNGGNKCTESKCCEYGYLTAAGWDPVTGLGSPNFSTLYSAIQATSSALYVPREE